MWLIKASITLLFEATMLVCRTTHTARWRKNIFRRCFLGSLTAIPHHRLYEEVLILSWEKRELLSVFEDRLNVRPHLRRSSCFLRTTGNIPLIETYALFYLLRQIALHYSSVPWFQSPHFAVKKNTPSSYLFSHPEKMRFWLQLRGSTCAHDEV